MPMMPMTPPAALSVPGTPCVSPRQRDRVDATPPLLTEVDPICIALRHWMKSLSPWAATQGRRGLHVLSTRGGVTIGSLFSGSDIAGRIFDKLALVFEAATRIPVPA